MTEIKLGSRRKRNHDYQYVREIKNHLNSIVNPEGRENMVNFSKSVADPWPHQCRYYKPCKEIVNNFTHNYKHFKRVHPWTDDEREYLRKLFEESANSKNVYILSFLYGRSESELKNFFQTFTKHIPKWGRKAKEVTVVHERINSQMQELRLEHRTKIEKEIHDRPMNLYWEKEAEPPKYELLPPNDKSYTYLSGEPVPTAEIQSEIQSQNYLIPPPVQPDKAGSKEFYKNLVDAFFEKHEAWREREAHLKNRVQELENTIAAEALISAFTISELKNKLMEKIEETVISDEEEAECNEQINKIRQPGF